MSYVVEHWSFDPFLVVVLGVVALHEVGLARLARRSDPVRAGQRRRRSLLFYAGLGVLLVAVVSPIDYWADDYLFVHMIEHILIAFFAPILVVAGAPWLPFVHGLPLSVRRRAGRALLLGRWAAPLRSVGRFVRNRWTALLVFNGFMVFWHLPGPFDAAETNQAVHIWLMHSSFFLTGVLFWTQIIRSYPLRLRTSALWQMGAIIGTNVVMFVLAMSMSIFTSTSWDPVYDHIAGVRLSPYADQQIAAAILWVCGDFWAIPALSVVIRRAIADEGGLADAVDRVFHRGPTPTLGELRRPG